ncbi:MULTISPECIES: hypothetical protein [Thiomicrorhabdus]|uniref:Lipoprotein n=1 Tax=Thiomicrorhabdus heinhorstiae TaxID=2748010 RepID=A0ABS0BSL1_9GAMM|nr:MULTISPECIES: hypothetical protein [Thiomicrorhabdus]MBF6056785.1 hypothetical protein [Thiomicrorhabdus heinhorstiae]
MSLFNRQNSVSCWGVAVALGIFLSGCAIQQNPPGSPLLNTLNQVSVCYDYGCKRVAQLWLQGTEWNQITKLFETPAESPEEERIKLARAIALMERFAGRVLGTGNDRAENSGTGETGQMDCVDESTNTTTYLTLFEKKGWLKWHHVRDKVVRSPLFFDIHWTAVIQENQSRQQFAVDSWFRENGREPVIMKLADWKLKREQP